MAESGLKYNFSNVVMKLQDEGMKPTNISKALGYTTTTQLARVTSGPGIPSSKAILSMVENLKVNPLYLFLGEGEMFLKDKTEEDRIASLNEELKNQLEELEKSIREKERTIRKLKDRQEDLLELLVTQMIPTNDKPESDEDSDQEENPENQANQNK